MDSVARNRMFASKKPHICQAGFTLVETLMSILILSGGLLALGYAFAGGLVLVSTSHPNQIAKERASEAIESVFTSRDTLKITWAQIRNVGDGGIFLDGPQPLRAQGPDGLVNTSDDADPEHEVLPGPDDTMGTTDDVFVQLGNYSREIIITNIAPNLRQIQVIVRYQIGHLDRERQLVAYISAFA